MEFFNLPRRFTSQGLCTFDHWYDEKLSQIAVANTPENLQTIHKIFSFHSSAMRNIVDFSQNNFAINILTQPFQANSNDALPELNARQAESVYRQYLAFLDAAKDWDMDFLDFENFQIQPGETLRFNWSLEKNKFPEAASIIHFFNRNRHLRFLNKTNYLEVLKKPVAASCTQTPTDCLYRSDHFAANLLHAYSMTGVKSAANLRIRINTKEPLQRRFIENTLFHNLNSDEILLIKIAAQDVSLSDFFSSCSKRSPANTGISVHMAREFGLFLKQSIFQKTILIVDGLAEKADGQFLEFLLESGDICGLTVILFNDALHFDCDLELNEDPDNRLQNNYADPPANQKPGKLSKKDRDLLETLAMIEVPVPIAVARSLATGPDGSGRLNWLIQEQYLHEKQQNLHLNSPGSFSAASAQEKKERLATLASRSDWPYFTIRHCIASGQIAALEKYMQKFAAKDCEKISPGPGAELMVSHLAQLARNQKLLAYFAKILLKTNAIDLAEKVLDEYADPEHAFPRLQKAHLAMRKKEYQKLGRLLAGFVSMPEECRDEWLYLNFIYHEKLSETKPADAFYAKIKAPYYRSLSVIQLSDRCIYQGDYDGAQSLLESALAHFQRRGYPREEVEIQNQLAKLQREKGCFAAAEELYKTNYIQSESDGFRLHAAFTAVDLGNLYLESDDDFQAEGWYIKARKLFEKEKNNDGIMLVNSNLVHILLGKGNWKEAENLLHEVLAHNEEKKLPISCAIDYLNWAGLEYARQDYGRALKLLEQSVQRFATSGNNKGLSECALLKCKILFAQGAAPERPASCWQWWNEDQKAVWKLCFFQDPAGDQGQEAEMLKQLAAIQSKKTSCEALAMLLKRHRQKKWLPKLKEAAWELSEKSRNFYYYEYWYIYFELAADNENIDASTKEHFLAMLDFFSLNKRKLPAKLVQLRLDMEESENRRALFDDARLVGNFRHWRLPEDFFNCFMHEIIQAMPFEWLAMYMFEKEQLLFRFSNSGLFKELSDEMNQYLARQPENQNFHLAEIKKLFHSQEKFFYPFANTKMLHWPISKHLSARIIVAFKDGDWYFQNFFERHREIFKKFALLFQNYFENEYQIHEKLHFIIGTSEKIKDMKRLIAQVSKVDFSLLISGESGSGKELVANAVHLLGPRAHQPFISVNAAAIPETLLEAELFGFKKGAFSGACENRVGLLEAADRGTLFLDEIADLPMTLQAKVLRVLQEKEIRRLGENKTIKIDIRLISASNKNLKALIQKNLFREDLYYRLQDLNIHIPPLRERREDIPALVVHFLKKFGYPQPDALRLQTIAGMYQNDDFPGNVRELESKIKNLITFNPDLEHYEKAARASSSLKTARQNFEVCLLRSTLNEHEWNKNKTAEKLQISRMALFNLLKKYNIKK